MARKEKSIRRLKKDLLEHAQRVYDPAEFDFEKRIKPRSGQAKIAGLIGAIIIYSLGFVISYYGWKNNNVSFDLFVKITWIIMLPASVLGIFVWLMAFNRVENALCHEYMKIIRPIEAEHGMIWRFRPLFSTFAPENTDVKKLLAVSESGQGHELDAEIYASAVRILFHGLTGDDAEKISVETAEEVEENLRQLQN